MPIDDPDKIDISLSLLGGDSQSAIAQLMDRMSDLDERLKAIALSPNQAASVAQQQRVIDRLRGVVPTGSVSGPAITLPTGSIYDPSGTGSVSPVSESNLRSRAKEALGSLYRGAPEGESRLVNASEAWRSFIFGDQPYQAKGSYTGGRRGMPPGGWGEGGGGPTSPGGASLPPGPSWMNSVDVGRSQTSFEMPWEGWGALSGQAKLELAADWMTRRAIRTPTNIARQAGQQAYDQAVLDASREAGGAELITPETWTSINDAARQAALDAFNQSAGNSILGQGAAWANRAAGQLPNIVAASSTAKQFAGGATSMLSGGNLQNVSFVDPALLNPFTYVRHLATATKDLQALGQQMGAQAGNEDVHGGLLTLLRNWQNPTALLRDPAALTGLNAIVQAMSINRHFSRVTAEQAGQFELGLGNYGFYGAQGNTILHSAAGVMQNTGLDPNILSQIYGETLQYGTGSISQVSNALHDLGQSAKNAHQNLDEYAQGLLEYGQAATMNGAGSIAQGMLQGRALSNAFPGLSIQDAQGLASNPFIQSITMMNTGLMPFQQGMLPGAALAQSTRQTVGFYMQAASAFARPSVTHTPYGNITTSARQAQIAAAAGMMGISAPELSAILRGDHRSNAVSGAESVVQAYLNPGAGEHVHIDPSRFLSQVYSHHAITGTQYKTLVDMMNTSGAKATMQQLQHILETNQGSQQNAAGQGIPDQNVTLTLSRDAQKLLQFLHHGKATSAVAFGRRLAQAGGAAAAQTNLDPTNPGNILPKAFRGL